MNAKEREVRRVKKKKGIEAKRAKPLSPIDALTGEEEWNENGKKNTQKETGSGP